MKSGQFTSGDRGTFTGFRSFSFPSIAGTSDTFMTACTSLRTCKVKLRAYFIAVWFLEFEGLEKVPFGPFLTVKQDKRCIALKEKQMVVILKEKERRKTGEREQRGKRDKKNEGRQRRGKKKGK